MPKTLKEIIAEKNARLNDVPDAFLTQIQKTQKSIFTEFLVIAETIERKGGFIVADAPNINKVAGIIEDLRDVLGQSEYPEIVQKFVEEFGVQKVLNDTYFEKAFTEFNGSTFADALLKKSQQDAIQAFLGSPVDSDFLRPIESLLTDSISSGAPWKETVTAIRDAVEGGDGFDGRLLSYSKGIAHDKFAISDRSYANAVNDELETEWYLYSGSVIDSSRCFCVERHQKYFHYLEIESWGRGEDLDPCPNKDGLWQGAFEDTNEKNIFLYAGGHQCRHSILGVSVFSVPPDVIQRNLSNGNYNPDAAERELLGI